MPGILQKIRSVLIPELGIDLEPEFLEEYEISSEFIRAIAHLAARAGNRSIMLRATSDGRLHVAAAGTSMEIYQVENGVAPDAYNVGSTYEQVDAQYITDLLIEANDATIQFRNSAGVWGAAKAIPQGAASIEFIHYGIRIQNRVALAVANYEFTMYR